MTNTIETIRNAAQNDVKRIVMNALTAAVTHNHNNVHEYRGFIEQAISKEIQTAMSRFSLSPQDHWGIVTSNHTATTPVEYDATSCGDSNSADLDDVMAEHADRIVNSIYHDAAFNLLSAIITDLNATGL